MLKQAGRRTNALALPPAHLLQQPDAHAVCHRGDNLIRQQPGDGCRQAGQVKKGM